jgi:alpha-mannosidase
MRLPNLRSRLLLALGVSCLIASVACAAVHVQTEQLNPSDSAWRFKAIPGPSKSDIATGTKVKVFGNQLESAAAESSVLVNGVLPNDSLDLSEEALLSNANPTGGSLVIDLGRVQPIAAVTSYSWHEWEVDQGSRGPQVYTLYGSAAETPDPSSLAAWTKIADVDTRPNATGEKWNGQHGAWVSDTSGKIGDFRHLLFAVQRTGSPLQPSPNLTGTLFAEIDVHTAASLARAGDAMVVKPAPIEHVWVVFKTHLDIGYTDTIEEVLKKYRVNMMEGALKVVEASRELPVEKRFSWTLAGWPLAHVLGPEQDPARRERIEHAVREGAITFHALPYTTQTETQDLEDLVRGLGYSTRLSKAYGRPLPISAKMTDVPSHSWVMPTLLAHAGVKFLQLGCNGTSAFIRVPPLFWWEGPDGSRVLCHYTPDYGSGLLPPRNWPSKHYLVMAMTGDNHGPPTASDVENLRQQAARQLPGVQVHFGTLDDFAKAVIAENPELSTVRADMPDTWIHGWLSMPIEAKAAHNLRPLEPALDMLDTQLRAWGVETGDLAPALAEAYAQSGLFSEHTFGPWGPKGGPWEGSLAQRYLYGTEWKEARAAGAYKKYEGAFDDKRAFIRKAEEIVHRELSQRLDLLAKSVNVDGKRTVVYNALPWERSGLVELPGQPGRFLFAESVPAGGYKTYRTDRTGSTVKVGQSASTTLETPFFKVVFDLKRGGIASLVDKKTGRDVVDKTSPYALGQFLHERFDHRQMLAFHDAYGRPGYSWWKGDLPKDSAYAALTPPAWTLTLQRAAAVDIATLTAVDTLGLAKGIAVVMTFPRHQPYVDVEWRVTEKTPDPMPEGGWFCFPFAVAQPRFLLGRLGGPVDPARDIVEGANRHYFCLHTGLTIRGQGGTGIGLCPVDSPCVSLEEPGLWKFSLDNVPKKPTAFVNLYNNEWNTNFPEWQDGSWSSRVRVWLTRGGGVGETLTVPSWEARLPLLAVAAEGPAGKLPKKKAGVALSRSGILVTAFGQNPDGAGTLLRLWEQAGQSGRCTVRLPAEFKVRSAQPINLRGELHGHPIPVRGRTFTAVVSGYAPAGFLLLP